MSMFTVFADVAAPAAEATAPAAAPAQQSGGFMSMVPIFVIFGVMIFFMIRSQKKQQQKRQEMLNKIAKGSKVVLASGMMGKIIAVNTDSYTVEIANGVQVEVVKNGIGDVVAEEATTTEVK